MNVTNFPVTDVGTMSPYPTPVTVTRVQYIPVKMVGNIASWSTTCSPARSMASATVRPAQTQAAPFSSMRPRMMHAISSSSPLSHAVDPSLAMQSPAASSRDHPTVFRTFFLKYQVLSTNCWPALQSAPSLSTPEQNSAVMDSHCPSTYWHSPAPSGPWRQVSSASWALRPRSDASKSLHARED